MSRTRQDGDKSAAMSGAGAGPSEGTTTGADDVAHDEDRPQTPRHLSRRWFLASLGAVVAGLSGWWGIRRDWADSIRSLIERRLDFLNLDPAGLDAFARDALKDSRVPFPPYFSVYSRVPVRFFAFLPARAELAALEDHLVEKYLLSTDFFLRYTDESSLVRYVAYSDRYARPCTNPFVGLGQKTE